MSPSVLTSFDTVTGASASYMCTKCLQILATNVRPPFDLWRTDAPRSIPKAKRVLNIILHKMHFGSFGKSPIDHSSSAHCIWPAQI